MAGLESFPNINWDQTASCSAEGGSRRPSSLELEEKMVCRSYQHQAGLEKEDEDSDKLAEIGVEVAGLLAENIACHPLVVIRRQCQVNVESRRYHTTPITLLPVLLNLNRWQGVSVLWKGLGSALIIKGITLAVEDCLSKLTPWPKEVDKDSSIKLIGQHLLLKCAAAAIITPFYSASLVETVQSEIASEKVGVMEVFREGVARLVSWSDPRCGVLLPVWVLIPPQVLHSVARYLMSTVVHQACLATHKEYQKWTGGDSRPISPGVAKYHTEVAALAGHFIAQCVLYPLETVLHRLQLQGTRSIIDNLDSGTEVLPILTRYEGVMDCFDTVVQEEGLSGLFKGFGAVLVQYAVHFFILKCSTRITSHITTIFSKTEEENGTDGELDDFGTQISTLHPSTNLETEHLKEE